MKCLCLSVGITIPRVKLFAIHLARSDNQAGASSTPQLTIISELPLTKRLDGPVKNLDDR